MGAFEDSSSLISHLLMPSVAFGFQKKKKGIKVEEKRDGMTESGLGRKGGGKRGEEEMREME